MCELGGPDQGTHSWTGQDPPDPDLGPGGAARLHELLPLWDVDNPADLPRWYPLFESET